MGSVLKALPLIVSAVTAAAGAVAHEAAPGSSGVLHNLTGPNHFLEFLVVGVMSGLYVRRFGGALYVCGVMLPLVLLASHSHVPLFTGAGLIFAAGFLSAGFLIAFAAANITVAFFEERAGRPSETEED